MFRRISMLLVVTAITALNGCTVQGVRVKGLQYTPGKTAIVDDDVSASYDDTRRYFSAYIDSVNGQSMPSFQLTGHGYAAVSSVELPANEELKLGFTCHDQVDGQDVWSMYNELRVTLTSGKCYELYGSRGTMFRTRFIEVPIHHRFDSKYEHFNRNHKKTRLRRIVTALPDFRPYCSTIQLREAPCSSVSKQTDSENAE
ncbi:hypothetical protein CRN52_13640 [Vibrio vulnificus]|uniref:Uncharacterized protein n=1 Tax=Vibrio vulnificus TaxID=672 RepID=A0A2S3R1X6_VIBVL|nr:hypothetical protein CRN52_13640 [Vibrio vulnificus]